MAQYVVLECHRDAGWASFLHMVWSVVWSDGGYSLGGLPAPWCHSRHRLREQAGGDEQNSCCVEQVGGRKVLMRAQEQGFGMPEQS